MSGAPADRIFFGGDVVTVDRDDLDAVSREHPVVALHVSAHLLAANSRALEVAGISGVTPDPEGGRIRRRDNGDATGVLEETAMNAVFARLPRASGQEAEEQALAAMEYYASFGATTAQEAALFSPSFMQACLRLSDAGEMPLDVVAYPLYTLARGMLAADSGRGHGRRFRLGGMKLLTDGSIQGYTAYLSRPYHAAAAGREPSYAGFPTFGSQEKLNAAVADGYANGWQVLAHANGDAAIGMVIEAARAADESHPGVDRRTTIIHAQTIREEQLDEVRELGLYVSFFPGHVYYWGDRHREVFLGPERAARINPMRSALDRGIPVTLHHDSPVTPPDILTAVWSAVNRVTSGGRELGPEQRMTPREAVRAVTIDAARQLFEEERKGSIEVGKLADLVLLAANPLEAGIDVDGVDASADMLAACAARCEERRIRARTYRQFLHELGLPRRYRLIFAGGASFGLIVDESEVTESLRRLYGHLLPGGTLLIEIETPRYVEQDTKRPDMSRDGGLAPMGRRSSCARVTGTTARLEL